MIYSLCLSVLQSKDNPEDGHIIKDRSLAVEGSHAKGFGSKTDEQIRKKDRIKKDNHNISKTFTSNVLTQTRCGIFKTVIHQFSMNKYLSGLVFDVSVLGILIWSVPVYRYIFLYNPHSHLLATKANITLNKICYLQVKRISYESKQPVLQFAEIYAWKNPLKKLFC